MSEILRTAHGKGAGALLRAETPPLDELTPPTANDTAKGLAIVAQRGRPFEPGNSAAKGRKPALAVMGVPLAAADPRCRAALKKANRLRQRRVRELAVQHGGYLGAGPCAMLANAARAYAASVVLYELAMDATAKGKSKEAADLFMSSTRAADSARQQELTAIAIAEREAKARRDAAGPDDPLLG